MVSIGAQQLNDALSALGEQLAASGAGVHLVVIGGSGLIALGVIDRATHDVDVVALLVNGELATAEPLPAGVIEAAALVARDFGLDANWLNPGPTSYVDTGLPEGFAGRLITRGYGPALQVSFAARVDQIHFKLYAWVDRQAPRDIADLRALDPAHDELRAAARWARDQNMPGPFDDAMARALAGLGVEDEGRIA
jgi:hypothetical protein